MLYFYPCSFSSLKYTLSGKRKFWRILIFKNHISFFILKFSAHNKIEDYTNTHHPLFKFTNYSYPKWSTSLIPHLLHTFSFAKPSKSRLQISWHFTCKYLSIYFPSTAVFLYITIYIHYHNQENHNNLILPAYILSIT